MGDMKINPENYQKMIEALEKDFKRKEARVEKKLGDNPLEKEAEAIKKRNERIWGAVPTGKGERKELIGKHRIESKEKIADPQKKETLADVDDISKQFFKEKALFQEKQHKSLGGRGSHGAVSE